MTKEKVHEQAKPLPKPKETSKEKEAAQSKAPEPSAQQAAKTNPLPSITSSSITLIICTCFFFNWTCISFALPRHHLMKSVSFLYILIAYQLWALPIKNKHNIAPNIDIYLHN